MSKFQEVLLKYKEQQGLSYKQFAEALSEADDITLNPVTVMGWKAGRTTPSLATLLKYYKAYELGSWQSEFGCDATEAWLTDNGLTFEMTDKFYDSL